MKEYLKNALLGFLCGYCLFPVLGLVILAQLRWQHSPNLTWAYDFMRAIFFSRVQYLFLGCGAVWAWVCLVRTNDRYAARRWAFRWVDLMIERWFGRN
jgi:hypothetical protein